MDMSPTLAPKSNQLNADDLIAGPRTITITNVAGTANEQQPVAVSYEGDNSKPYYPCKSMRRVMVSAWGPDAKTYAGRSMTLFRDPEVSYGGMQVGGIRISHMSHMDADLSIALTITRQKRAPYKVKRLTTPPPAAVAPNPPQQPQPAAPEPGPEPARRRIIPTSGPTPAAPVRRIATPESTP
jgi:hypothetical protein